MNININNYEEWMIDYVEGNLSKEQQKQFAEFLALHPELQSELDIFRLTKLQPDMHVVFTGKESLKQKENGKVVAMPNWVRYASAIAAVMLLFIGIRFFTGNREEGQMAIKKYEGQSIGTPFAYDRKTDSVIKTKGNQKVERREVVHEYAEMKPEKETIQAPAAEQKLLQREQINVEEIELAAMKPIHTRTHVSLKYEMAGSAVSENDAQFASTQQSDKSKNISLNDNNSIVDWMNDAFAMGGEVGGLVESFVLKDEKTEAVNDAPYKTTSVNLFGISYYSRKKTN